MQAVLTLFASAAFTRQGRRASRTCATTVCRPEPRAEDRCAGPLPPLRRRSVIDVWLTVRIPVAIACALMGGCAASTSDNTPIPTPRPAMCSRGVGAAHHWGWMMERCNRRPGS